VLACLAVAGCSSRPAQPMNLRLDVIERALQTVEVCSVACSRDAGCGCAACDGGARSTEQSIELHQRIRETDSALRMLRDAIDARERGDGRRVDERVEELGRRLGALERVLSSLRITAPPGLFQVIAVSDGGATD
jgi:hypothetical protein